MDWNNKQMVLEAVKQEGLALLNASNELQNNKEVVLEAVKQEGMALEYASDELQNNKEIVIEAVKKDSLVLFFASERLQDDKDVLNTARDYLMSDRYIGHSVESVFINAKENLLKYDREDELLSKLEVLDKLQAQQQNSINQPKAEVKSRRKV